MKDLFTLPWDVYVVPLGAIGVALGVSKLLKISQFFALIGALLPLWIPHAEIPLLPGLSQLQPYYQVAGGWGVFCVLGVVWVLLRSCLRVAGGPFGALRVAYRASLGASLLLAGILFASPDLLQMYAPGWRGSGGLFLLATAVVGVIVAFLKIFRSAAQLLVWSCVVLVLGSEILFQKLPTELEQDDLKVIESVLPVRLVSSTVRRLVPISAAIEDSLRSATSRDVES